MAHIYIARVSEKRDCKSNDVAADRYRKAGEDAALLYERIKPVQEEYNLPEDDMENILEEILAEL